MSDIFTAAYAELLCSFVDVLCFDDVSEPLSQISEREIFIASDVLTEYTTSFSDEYERLRGGRSYDPYPFWNTHAEIFSEQMRKITDDIQIVKSSLDYLRDNVEPIELDTALRSILCDGNSSSLSEIVVKSGLHECIVSIRKGVPVRDVFA